MPDKLIRGAIEFKKEQFSSEYGIMPLLAAEGQNPKNFIISCIDSRCNPGVIFKAPPGSFFSHKAMGAIVRPYKKGTALAAALQFALNYNHIENIIVLGHTGCGAIKAMVEDLDDEEIRSFISEAKQSLKKAEHHDLGDAERKIIINSIENLTSYPSVKEALAEKRVTLQAFQSPALAFLIGGMLISACGSKLQIPTAIYQFAVFMLLLRIGINGGMEIREANIAEMIVPIIATILVGLIIVFIGAFVLTRLPGVKKEDGIATAGLFGAVSASTLAAAMSVLEYDNITYEAWAPALYPFMDIPALVLAIVMANLYFAKTDKNKGKDGDDDKSKTNIPDIIKDSLRGSATVYSNAHHGYGGLFPTKRNETSCPLVCNLCSDCAHITRSYCLWSWLHRTYHRRAQPRGHYHAVHSCSFKLRCFRPANITGGYTIGQSIKLYRLLHQCRHTRCDCSLHPTLHHARRLDL